MSEENDTTGPRPHITGDDPAEAVALLLEHKGARAWLALALARATSRDVLLVITGGDVEMAPNWWQPSFQRAGVDNAVLAAVLPEAVAVEVLASLVAREAREAVEGEAVEGEASAASETGRAWLSDHADAATAETLVRGLLCGAPVPPGHIRALTRMTGCVMGACSLPIEETQHPAQPAT